MNESQNKKFKSKTNKGSNAAASAFGWDFQANAAILLMLENIKEAKSVKVEAETEDIEITLNNNNIIYSQAKSIENINSISNLLEKLKDGLRTLNNAYNNQDAECLIYITNHSNPFNDKTSIQYFLGRSKLKYEELTEECKKKIDDIITKNNYSIDTNKLKIYTLPFYGSDKDNRDKAIKEAVGEFLDELDINSPYTPKRMLEIWQKDFFHNSTIPDSTLQIKKKDMMWALIAEACKFNPEDNFLLYNCDEGDIDEIEYKYKAIINNKTEEFVFANKILSDYEQYSKSSISCKKMEKFINEEYVRYSNEFDIKHIDERLKNCLIKVILHKIITKKHLIGKIKKGANI